jgi:AraC-like DNA-binding protein
MCFLEIDMPDPWITKPLPVAAINTPLGMVSLAGQSRANRGIDRASMRVLGSYALVYVVAGRSEFGDANGFRATVQAGDAFLLFPEVAHYYDPGPGEPWDDIWLVFNGPAFDAWRAAGLLDPKDPVWHLEPVAHWRQRIAGVLTGATGAGASLVEVTRWLGLLAEMRVARTGGLGAARREIWLESACQALDAMSAPDWNRLAGGLGLTYEQFRKKFSAAMGLPPAQYRLARRMDQAALRLRADDAPLKAIAAELGFCDEFHFSKLFKRRTGISPSAYRAQWRGAYAARKRRSGRGGALS